MNKSATLHIANKPKTLELIASAGIPGDGLAWQDPLYEGPILSESVETLSEIRARYLSDNQWGNYYGIRARFRERDATLRNFRHYDQVVLWFDHDLLDQLQLLQILNWFSQQTIGNVNLMLVYCSHIDGVFRFSGLETLHPQQIAKLYCERAEVSVNQMELALHVWDGITSNDPLQLHALQNVNARLLPFVKDAVSRLLEEYPDKNNGLSRTEKQIGQVIYSGVTHPLAIYELVQRKEKIPYMSEQSFRRHLYKMLTAEHPLVAFGKNIKVPGVRSEEFLKQQCYITNTGFNILAESADHIFLNGIDRWVGGVHLTEENIWRISDKQKLLKRTYA